jgi:inner membrane protein
VSYKLNIITMVSIIFRGDILLGTTHICIGLVAAAASVNVNSIDGALLAITGAIIGSITPDIDHPDSLFINTVRFKSTMFYSVIITGSLFWMIYKGRDVSYSLVLLIIILVFFIGVILFSIFNPHRTLTHSLLGLIIYSSCIFVLLKQAWFPFFIGYAGHLAGDFITNAGIPLFYPCLKRIGPRWVETGSKTDKVVGKVCIALFALICIYRGYLYLSK